MHHPTDRIALTMAVVVSHGSLAGTSGGAKGAAALGGTFTGAVISLTNVFLVHQ